MAAAMTPILGAYFSESGKSTMTRLGLDADKWEVTNPHLKDAIRKQSFTFCQETNAKTSLDLDEALRQLRARFAEGLVDRGETLVELTKRVEEIFDRIDRWRAEAIAATEASRAVHHAQELAAEESGVVAGFELLLSADACPLCRMIATEARRVRLGQLFAVIGSHPEYSKVKYPPLHPRCQCTVVEILKPEYGGPDHVDWYDTLVQPIAKDWKPSPGKAVPKPDPAKARAPLRPKPGPFTSPHPEVHDRVPKPEGRPEGPGFPDPLPPDLDVGHLRSLDLHQVEPSWKLAPDHGKLSYGGVIFDEQGRVLLREPTNHFDGYVWTFPKGKVDAGEHPVDAALREVKEETGHEGGILGLVPGGFKGGTGTNYYFIMRSKADLGKTDAETAATRWATIDEARALIAQTTNAKGRARDLSVLEAAAGQFAKIRTDSSANAALKARPTPPPPPAFVPDEAEAGPRAKARKARKPKATKAAAEFPADPHALVKVQDLGGSTGAELVQDPATGRKYVRKKGANADHLREECLADGAYRQLGARVPAFHLYETGSGPVKLSEFIPDAKPLGALMTSDPKLAAKAIADLKTHFAADALLGNWDVIGMSGDNVLVDPQGNAYRVDNGGALRFRAQGAPKKASDWDAYPTELWTLRDRAKNAQTARVFGDLSIREIAGQVEAMEGVKLDLPEAVAKTVQARMGQLKDVARRANTFLDDRFKDGHTDGLCKHMIGLRKAGARDRMPETLTQQKGSTTVKDQDGKDFDHLRGKDSLVAKLQQYIDANGGDYRLAAGYMSGQAGSSWSEASKALKFHLAESREVPDSSFYWAGGRKAAEKAYRAQVEKAGSEEKYRATFQALHAFTHDYLEKADFTNKDAARGTIRLMRTEDKSVMRQYNLKVGQKGCKMERGVAESTSIYKKVTVYGSELTVQDVPIHRVLATYWQERNGGRNDSAFLGDGENEFVCMLEGIPFNYEK
jgi:8-oxo-dGTP pyrophosphatase MutT (NUDIX family)